MSDDWAGRIGRHLTTEGAVVVPARIAAWLEQKAGVTADRRIALRNTDPQAYEVLAALHLAALAHWTANGTKHAAGQPAPQELTTWLTAAEAAHQAEVTDSAIRKWIRTGRLPATKRGGRWLINRNDLHAHTLAA